MIQRTLDPVNDAFATYPSILTVRQHSSLVDPQWKRAAPTAVLLLSDAMAIAASLMLASMAWEAGLGAAPWVIVIPILLGGLALSGAYAAPMWGSLSATFVRVAAVLSIAGMAFGAGWLLVRYPIEVVAYTFGAWAAAMVLVPAGRLVSTPLLRSLQRRGMGRRPVIVVGTAPEISLAAETLETLPGPHRLAGVIELQPVSAEAGLSLKKGRSVAAPTEDVGIETLLERVDGTHDFLLAASPTHLREVEAAVRPLLPENAFVYLDLSALLSGPQTGNVGVIGNGIPAVRIKPRHECWRYAVAKRLMDVVVACTALIVAAPLMLLIAVAIKLDSRGPALFHQTRVGRHGRMFSMYKFRSMRTDAEALRAELEAANEAKGPMFKIKDDPRITRVGRLIRRLSLDELPQLFNVLQGTMSIVGPRPPLPREVMEYKPWQLRRLELTPGITGLWQVSRLETSSFEEMVQLDLAYTDNWCLSLDARILLKTLPAMIMARGAY